MLVKNLYKKIGTSKGWQYDKLHTKGFEKDYFVIVFQEGIYRRISIFFKPNDKVKLLEDFIKKNKRKLKVADFVITEEGISIAPNEFWKVIDITKLQIILDSIISKLIEFDTKPYIPSEIISE